MRKKNTEKLNKAVQLFKSGMTQKEIALSVGVTEKTITIWLKPYKVQSQILTTALTKAIKRLNKILDEPDTSTTQIKDLTYTIATLKGMQKQ